jgi:hypothetical protein
MQLQACTWDMVLLITRTVDYMVDYEQLDDTFHGMGSYTPGEDSWGPVLC